MKKILILFLIALTLTSCGKKEEEKTQKFFKTAEVGTGIVNETENYIGYTKGIEQVMLATKAPGRISYLEKKLGDKVDTGELLVSLGNEEARNGFNTAQNITNKLINLKTNTNKALDEQIKAMQAKIESVKAQIKGVTTGLEDTKDITEKQLETAKANLEQTKKELDTKKQTILTGAKSSLTYTSMISTNIMDFVENLLGMDHNNDDFNDKIDEYLGMKNSNQLNNTEILYRDIVPLYKDYKDYYTTNIENKSPDEKTLIEGLEKAKTLGEKLSKLLNDTYTVIDNSIENIYMPLSMINEFKKQTTTLGSKLEQTMLTSDGGTILGVKGSLENLNNFETQKQKAITLLEKQVAQYESMARGQVNNVNTKKDVANLGLKEAEAGLQALLAKKEATLREIDTKIAQAVGQKNQSSVMINNGNIIAPFSGIITNKMAEEGQVINAGMPILELANNSKIKLKLQIPENIKNNLNIGDKIDVSLENNPKVFIGILSNVSSAVNPINKKYEVEIILENKDKKIPVGKMAIVSFNSDFENIETQDNQNHIRIPNSAIIEKFMIPGIYIFDGKKAHFKNIKILKMGQYFSEVEGLNPGDKVITDGKENIFDGEELR